MIETMAAKPEHSLSNKYKEILVLDKMLTKANIPHTLSRMLDGYQLCYMNDNGICFISVIEHCFSYGHEEDLLELIEYHSGNRRNVNNEYVRIDSKTAFDVFKRCRDNDTAFHYEKYVEDIENRLSEYESTGLSPDEIRIMIKTSKAKDEFLQSQMKVAVKKLDDILNSDV